MYQKRVDLREVIQILELPLDTLSCLQSQNGLEEFKETVRKQRKLLAKKYHPDVTNGDDAKMKQINAVIDFVEKIYLIKPQPIVIRFYSNSTTTDTTSWY